MVDGLTWQSTHTGSRLRMRFRVAGGNEVRSPDQLVFISQPMEDICRDLPMSCPPDTDSPAARSQPATILISSA